jgi:hypothetical protein
MPPAGGFGSAPATVGRRAPPHTAGGLSPWAWFAIVVGLVVVVLLFSVWGVRRYIGNAKSAEARMRLPVLANGAAAAYERDGRLCPSAKTSVPATLSTIRGGFYTPRPFEFREAGFDCIGVTEDTEISSYPMYFLYDYRSSGDSFAVIAHGDLNQDGKESTFILRGRVVNGHVKIADEMEITDEGE